MKNMHHFCVKAAVAFFLILPVAACGGGGGSSAGPSAGPGFRTVLDMGADVSGVQTTAGRDGVLDTTRRFYSGRFRSSNGGGGVGAGARAANHLSGVGVSEIIASYGRRDSAFIAVLTANHGRVARPLDLPPLDGDQVSVESVSNRGMVNLNELVGPTDPADPESETFAFINGDDDREFREFGIFNAEEFAVLGIWISNIDDFALVDDYTGEFALIHFGVNPGSGSIPDDAANAVYTSNSIQGYYTDSTGRYLITSAAMSLMATFGSSTPMFSGNIEITGGGAPLPFPFPLPLDNEDGTVDLVLMPSTIDLPDIQDPSATFSGMVNVQTASGIFTPLLRATPGEIGGDYEGAFYGDATELAGTLEVRNTAGTANLLLGFFADEDE